MDALTALEFRRDDPARPPVAVVIEAHLALMRASTPPEGVFALPIDALRADDIRFYSLSQGQQVIGIGAIRLLADGAGELKSMHVLAASRGQGLGQTMVAHLQAEARAMGLSALYLETGPGEAHAAARRLYGRAGFVQCGPFGGYAPDPHSYFMVFHWPDAALAG